MAAANNAAAAVAAAPTNSTNSFLINRLPLATRLANNTFVLYPVFCADAIEGGGREGMREQECSARHLLFSALHFSAAAAITHSSFRPTLKNGSGSIEPVNLKRTANIWTLSLGRVMANDGSSSSKLGELERVYYSAQRSN